MRAVDDTIWELCRNKLSVVGGAMGEGGADEGAPGPR